MKKLLLPTFSGGVPRTTDTPLPIGSSPQTDLGSTAATIATTAYYSPSVRPTCIAFSPDGLTLYVAGGNTIYSAPIAAPNTTTLLVTVASGSSIPGMAVSPDGLCLYFTTFNECKIYKHVLGGATSVLAGSGVAATTDGVGTSAAFSYPGSIDINADGTKLLIATAFGSVSLRLIDLATATVTTVANTNLYRGNYITAVAFAGSKIYSASSLSYYDENATQQTTSEIYETDIATGIVNLVAGTGVVGRQTSERSGSFNFYTIRSMKSIRDSIYVVDSNGTLGRFKPAIRSYKKILGAVDQPSAAYLDGTGTTARLGVNGACSLGLCGSRLFVSEFVSWRIREITNFI